MIAPYPGTMQGGSIPLEIVVLEADEAAIEEMVGIGREEQAILSIEALLVARVPPRKRAGERVNYLRYDSLP